MRNTVIAVIWWLFPSALYTQTQVSGTINSQLWTPENSPYVVVGDIRVVSLEIQPGVEVLFDGNYIFEVAGILKAVGTETDSIVFTKTDTSTGWRGIFFNISPPGSDLAYCTIESSTEHGILFNQTSQTIRNCTIANNSSSLDGAGILVTGVSSTVTLNCCIISNNSTSSSNDGGGIYIGGTVNLNNCRITRNTARLGGGIYVVGRSTLTNCIIANNIATSFTAERGGGVHSSSGTSLLKNCTVVSNGEYGLSGGTSFNPRITVENSIVFFHGSRQISSGNNVTYSDVQGGFSGIGNINVNPVFIDDSTFVLSDLSPCIDAGNPDSAFNEICSQASKGTSRNDMGAYGGSGACDWVAPVIPSLTLPPNGSTEVPTDLTFRWNASPGATSYRFQISTDSSFSSVVFDTSGLIETEFLFSRLLINTSYYWHVNASNTCRLSQWSSAWRFSTTTTSVNDTHDEIPMSFNLYQNYPNPFNPSTTIHYTLPQRAHVTIRIFTLRGEEIEALVSGIQMAGEYEIQWVPKNIASGIYLYRLESNYFIMTRKMILLR
jgi:hypothetical protein